MVWKGSYFFVNLNVVPADMYSPLSYSCDGTSITRIVGSGGDSRLGYDGVKLYTGCGDALLPSDTNCDISMLE